MRSLDTPALSGEAPALAYCGFSGVRGFPGICCACALTTSAACPVSFLFACAPALLAFPVSARFPLCLYGEHRRHPVPTQGGCGQSGQLDPLLFFVSTNSRLTIAKLVSVHFLHRRLPPHTLGFCVYLLQDWYSLLPETSRGTASWPGFFLGNEGGGVTRKQVMRGPSESLLAQWEGMVN